MSHRQPKDNKMPQVVGKSKITLVRQGSPSLKITIPQTIAENMGLKDGDVVQWRLDFVGEDKILTLEKGKVKEADKPS